MNDIFFLLGSDLHNFAGENTVTAVAECIQGLVNSLEVKTSNAIEWMKDSDMIAILTNLKLLYSLKLNKKIILNIIQLILNWNSARKPFSLAMELSF